MSEPNYDNLPQLEMPDLHRLAVTELPMKKGEYYVAVRGSGHKEQNDSARREIKELLKSLNMTLNRQERYPADTIREASWVLLMELFPFEFYQARAEKSRSVEPILDSPESEVVDIAADVLWVYRNLLVKNAEERSDIPGPGAVGMLHWARKNSDTFYKNHVPRAIAAKDAEAETSGPKERLLKDSATFQDYKAHLNRMKSEAEARSAECAT